MCNEHYLPGLGGGLPTDKQSDKNDRARNLALNVDGLGLAWYSSTHSSFVENCSGPMPTVYKSISPPLNDYNYRNLCANTATKLLFAHVRASSGSAVSQSNVHPFVFGKHIFMHNGTITNFTNIRRQVCQLLDADTYAKIDGATDSEHLAALYITILTKGRGKAFWNEDFSCRQMATALREAISTVIRIQKQVLGDKATPNSLNLAVSDGIRFLAIRFRNHTTEEPPSLYWSTTAGVTLNRKYPGDPDHPEGVGNLTAKHKAKHHGKHLIVASEPTTMQEKEWKLIEKNHCIMVERGGTPVIEKIPYNDDWNVDGSQMDWVMVEKNPTRLHEKSGRVVVERVQEIDDEDWTSNRTTLDAKHPLAKCLPSCRSS